MNENLTCHTCGSAMVRDVRAADVSYKGHVVKVEQLGWYCTGCDEAVLVGEDAAVTESAFIRLKVEVDGILSPSEVQRIRTKLGLSQRRAGALLGGGPRSFQKYESGTDWITRSMANLLRLLDKAPARLAELAVHGGPDQDASRSPKKRTSKTTAESGSTGQRHRASG